MDADRLRAICAALGSPKEDENNGAITYVKGEYCLDSLKDLQRFLRRDDPYKREVFKQICKWNTVSRHLVPVIEFYQNERNLVINSVKILVFLTMPVDPNSYDIAQQIEYLWELKLALTRNVTIAIIVSLLEDPLDHLESDTFSEDDWKLVQLILTLFRNLLAIREITLHQKACGSATEFLQLADNFLELMFQENVMDIILVLTQHLEESCGFIKHDNLLFLEIFHYVFLGRDPEMVAKSSIKGSKDGEISTTVDSLKSLMEKEAKKRKEIGQRSLERHSQFSGTFTRFLMDGSKTLYKGKPKLGLDEALLKVHKIQRGPQKRIAWDQQLIVSPKENILEALRSFLEQFLSGGYNVLMQSIRNDIKKEHPSIQNNDIITFFQVIQFVLAFQYHNISILKKNEEKSKNLNICGPVAETVNEEMFKLVINRWQEIFEGIKQTNDYKSLSASGSLMKHMIFMIDLVLKLENEDSREAHTSRILLYKLFYDQTEQGLTHFILNLFKSFDMHKQPKSDLSDLLEIIHVIFRLMESLQQRGALRVAKKARSIKKKKIPKISPEEATLNPAKPSGSSETPAVGPAEHSRSSEDQAEQINPAVGPTEPSRNSENQKDPPVDPTEPSRNSENQLNPSMGCTEPSRNSEDQTHNQPDPAVNPDPMFGTEQETADSSSEEEEDETPQATNEVDFNVSRLVTNFVTNTIVHNLCWLLKHYKSNSVRTNHYIVCMLQRICDDLGLTAMLYQLSLLTTFYEILAEQKSSKSKEHSNIVNFLTKLVRGMMRLFVKQPLLFVKILFWKTRRECHYISADALISEAVNMRNDLNNSFRTEIGTGFLGFNRNIADSLGDDEADLVPNYNETQREDFDLDGMNGNEGEKTDKSMNKRRRLKIKSLSNHEEMINDKSDSIPNLDIPTTKVAKRRRSSIFSPLQENIIKDLFEKHKEDRKCCRIIAEAMDPNGNISPVQISRKLKQLGLRNITRKKNVETESPVSVSTDDDDDEPLQTLISRRKRGKDVLNEKSEINEINEGLDLDNETLGSIFSQRKKSKRRKDVLNEKSQLNEINEGLNSDNETLGSVFRNKSKSHVQNKSPAKDTSLNLIVSALDHQEHNLTNLKGSDSPDLLDDEIDSEPENTGIPKRKTLELNLLEDSDDETGQRNTGSKRSLKILLDCDDDF